MVGRRYPTEAYRVVGWSYRLFPEPALCDTEPNRGSAFNSCLAMSVVPTIDRLYLMSRMNLLRFQGGKVVEI